MTDFSGLNGKLTGLMDELVRVVLPTASPEMQAKFKADEHKCRWCEGHGSVWVSSSPSGHPNDPDSEDFECACPECDGGLVSQAVSEEQHEYSESYMDDVYERAWEQHTTRYDEDY